MPRARRVTQSQNVYHLISRFVASEWFIRGNEERRQYLRLLGLGLKASDWRCLSYAVMSNHIHLGMLAGTQPLADWIRGVHTPFAEWINERHDRIGAVFVRGPKDFRVRPDGVAKVIGYIHRNPVRAGVVSDPRDSDWTSHAAYLGLAERPAWLDTAKGLELAGFRDPEKLDEWIRATAIDRAAAKAALVLSRRGRPRKMGSDPISARRVPG
jgi:REP element-mobilizing transposase RayT